MEARGQLDEIRKAEQQKFIEHTYQSVLDIHNQLIDLIASFQCEMVDIVKITNNEEYSSQQQYCFEKLNEMRGDDSRGQSRIKSFGKDVNELINALYDNLKKINAENKAPNKVGLFNDKIEQIILALDEFIDCPDRNYNVRYKLYEKVSKELRELKKIYGDLQDIIREDIACANPKRCTNPKKDEESTKIAPSWIDFTELHPDIYIKGIAQCKSFDEFKQFTAVFYELNHFSRNFFLPNPNAEATATITATDPEAAATAVNLRRVVYKRVSELLSREKLNSALDKAIKENNISAFRLFFSYDAADFNRALRNAATCGSVSILQELLKVSEDIKKERGEAIELSSPIKKALRSALNKAIKETYTKEGTVNNDKVEIFELLLKFHASNYATSLISATENNNLFIVKSLLDRRAIFKSEISSKGIQKSLNKAIETIAMTDRSEAPRAHEIFDMLFACENIDYKKLLIVAARNISPRAVGAILEKCDSLKAQNPKNDLLLPENIKMALKSAVCSSQDSERNQKRVIEMLLAREAVGYFEVILSSVDNLLSVGHIIPGVSVILEAKGAEIAKHPEVVSMILPKLIWNGGGLFKAFFDLGTQLEPNFGDSVLNACLSNPEILELVLNGHVSKRYAISRTVIINALGKCVSSLHIENFQTLFEFEAKCREDFQLSKDDYEQLLKRILYLTKPPIELLTIFLEGLKARHCSFDFNQETYQFIKRGSFAFNQQTPQLIQRALSKAIRRNNVMVFKLLSDHFPADYDALLTVAKDSGHLQIEVENLVTKANQAKEAAQVINDAISKEIPRTRATCSLTKLGVTMLDEAEMEEEKTRAAAVTNQETEARVVSKEAAEQLNGRPEIEKKSHNAVAVAPRNKLGLFSRVKKSLQKKSSNTSNPNNDSKSSKRI